MEDSDSTLDGATPDGVNPDGVNPDNSIWARLVRPFGQESVEWRLLELAEDGQRARVRPQLRAEVVTARLDEVLRIDGWSNVYTPWQDAVICTLTVEGVSKAAVSAAPQLGPAERARDALVLAAEGFGLRPAVDQGASYWVDYNPEAGEILYEPEAVPAAPAETPPAPEPKPQKSEGQKAIDRLVERLKGEGKGAQVARLVVEFSGYGGNPEQSRELYRRLRALLKTDAA
ncbi:hypothetical protein BH24DEI1_BH24DEI1_01320 [soil metagenome]|nr:hypothetical protein [Deinococcota bacterium]